MADEELPIESSNDPIEISEPKSQPSTRRKSRKPRVSNAAAVANVTADSKETKKKGKPAPLPWTFPKNPLEDALSIPKAIEEENAGNPMRSEMVARAVGFSTVNDWRFLELLRSANQYGLVDGSGRHASVKLTDIGIDVVSPSTPSARQTALTKAFHSVDQFSRVDNFYSGKNLPEDEFFENTLHRDFDVARDRVKTFIEVFTKNLNYLHAFRRITPVSEKNVIGFLETDRKPALPPQDEQVEGTRTFLDTCFVMMPFGQWLDTYYREIFIPAIKEAGMEPVRGDELFSTGSVIEQIWDQIQRAKVLLADLSGKNANVFYELGLAHAAYKPVVFTTSNLEDVPFDLRHLRVVTYDIRDPAWGIKLQKSLATYLRAAKTDPAKSVPQPFRQLVVSGIDDT